jgi:Protein of unknown function (DUF3828)
MGGPKTVPEDRMRRRSFLARVSAAISKLACAFLLIVIVVTPVSLAQAEDPSAAVVRFYYEYMGSGVALKPLGDRWFTARFRGIMNAWDGDPLQKPIEGNPILPWKDWDAAWRHKLKADTLQASAERALVLVTFAKDGNGRPIARLVHLEKVGDAWRVDDVAEAPHNDQ